MNYLCFRRHRRFSRLLLPLTKGASPLFLVLPTKYFLGKLDFHSSYTMRFMEEFLIVGVGYLRLTVEAIGVAVIGTGAVLTTYRYFLSLLGLRDYTSSDIRLYLGRFLVLGLEFQLAGNILATAVSPTFEEVQLLAAIVVIRTVLTYFLQKEVERKQALPEPGHDT
jgi:uncharacterized membrane protein